jgi:hypothetical protein
MKNLIMFTAVLLILTGAVAYKIRALQNGRPQNEVQTQGHVSDDFRIEGRVINANGDVVPGATVYAELDRAGVTRILTDVSDSNGNFRIKIRELGQYTIYGSKEEDGYPLTVSGFHQSVPIDQIPKLNITERKTVSGVVLQLGEQAAIIEGTVKDEDNGELIRTATVTLRRADNPDLLYRTSIDQMRPGRFRLAVPQVPFDVEVDSTGYEHWTYQNGKKEPIKLNRRESKILIVSLRKQK